MNKARYRSPACMMSTLFVMVLCMPVHAPAEDSENSRESLRGLKGVYLSVEQLDPEIERDGLTKTRIASEVALRLRAAGIMILSKAEWFTTKGSPYLYINPHVVKLNTGREYLYCVKIAFKQNVYPLREPVEILGAATWSAGSTLGITPHLNSLLPVIKEQVDGFISAYLSINPP